MAYKSNRKSITRWENGLRDLIGIDYKLEYKNRMQVQIENGLQDRRENRLQDRRENRLQDRRELNQVVFRIPASHISSVGTAQILSLLICTIF